MSVIIGADAAGIRLKEVVKEYLEAEGFQVVDVTEEGQDFVDVTLAVAKEVKQAEDNLGIVIDAYGAGQLKLKEWLQQKFLMSVLLI